jgi:hypothetical protein
MPSSQQQASRHAFFIAEMRILCMAAKEGPNVLFCMQNTRGADRTRPSLMAWWGVCLADPARPARRRGAGSHLADRAWPPRRRVVAESVKQITHNLPDGMSESV